MSSQALPDHVRALLQPGVLAPPDTAVELVQTHISYVLLAGDRVYKLKKPREFGFLDYSTLARRRTACQAEVALNRRLTSDVYLGVTPVTRDGDAYRIGGEGEAVDYAVMMRRLPADRMMDRLVARDTVSPALLGRLARHLASFYEGAAAGPHIDRCAEPAALLANWQENFLQTLPYAGRTIGLGAYVRIARAVYHDLLRLRPLWWARLAAGRVRDGHGDLRLSAVCLEDDAIQVYDCIEFNERFRYGDVAADIAFLAMDLDAHGRPDLADELVARFVSATADRTLPALLPFYRCYRAFVRGKVNSFQLDEPEVPVAQRRTARAAARRRFALATAYAGQRRVAVAVVIGRDARTRDDLAAALAGRIGAVLDHAGHDGGAPAGALRHGIPVVLTAATLPRDVLKWDSVLSGRRASRSLVIACEPADAPPGAVALSGGPLRSLLRELQERLPGLYRSRNRRLAGAPE